jgi:hypothetical protein
MVSIRYGNVVDPAEAQTGAAHPRIPSRSLVLGSVCHKRRGRPGAASAWAGGSGRARPARGVCRGGRGGRGVHARFGSGGASSAGAGSAGAGSAGGGNAGAGPAGGGPAGAGPAGAGPAGAGPAGAGSAGVPLPPERLRLAPPSALARAGLGGGSRRSCSAARRSSSPSACTRYRLEAMASGITW